jgi:membrane-bound lytic murein transglycosylase B
VKARLSPYSLVLLLLLAACAHHPVAPAKPVPTGYLAREDVQKFISHLATDDGLDKPWLQNAFAHAEKRQPILDAIARPYEAKPWYQYRPLFVNDARISGGIDFWNQQGALLGKAHDLYGVPEEIIVAIIGVETFYGRQHGGYPVIDALTTLAFDYPPRAAFFQGELEQYFIMCHEQGQDPLTLTGSYAGAMGAPQFMPDSYRQYAVDFDNDGRRDVWDDWADIIGSVANYFEKHGWKSGELIVVPAALAKDAQTLTPLTPTTVGELRKGGVVLSTGVGDDAEAVLVALEEEDHSIRYWVGLHNFRVLTQYNRSPLYAMAVIELADSVAERRAVEDHDELP